MKNVGISVQARLKNLSKTSSMDMPSLLRRYVQERLLYRLSASGYAERFALKGGLLMAAYNDGDLTRPTEDIDFNGLGEGGSIEELRETLIKVLSAPAEDDGVVFMLDSMTIAKDRTGIVPGGKIVMNAKVGTANVDLRVDVGFGNPVTPAVSWIDFPSLLSEISPAPTTAAYPLETVIAEKLHAMAQFGVSNTRVKDYYDILMLSRRHRFEGDLLAEAVERTFAHQRRPIEEDFTGLSPAFVRTAAPIWKKFCAKLPSHPGIELEEAVREVSDFVSPVVENARTAARDGSVWEPDSGWSAASPRP